MKAAAKDILALLTEALLAGGRPRQVVFFELPKADAERLYAEAQARGYDASLGSAGGKATLTFLFKRA